MPQAPVPLIVLSPSEDDAELINKTLRDAGHAVHCHWVQHIEDLAAALDTIPAELLWYRADGFAEPIEDIVLVRNKANKQMPLLILTKKADEKRVAQALLAGARDLVTAGQRDHLRAVAERELRAYGFEQAFHETLESATQYKKQLQAFVADSVDALAYVQEGIIVQANQAWNELFAESGDTVVDKPLMDLFASSSQAAVKGAVVACMKGRWNHEPLSVAVNLQDGTIATLELDLEPIDYDGEPSVKLEVTHEASDGEPAREIVEHAVYKDPATGFYHRPRFLELLTEQCAVTPRNGVRALAYIRPDKFSDIEEEVGPLASEDLIGALAQVLRELVHPNDICARFGGNVFAILFERGTLRDVEAWADNAIQRISDHIFEVADNTLSITCTIGIAEAGPATERIDALIIDAEKANRRGRQRGGDQVVLQETSDESTRIQRFDALWVHQLKSALLENRLRLAYFPITSLGGEQEGLYDTVLRLTDEQGDEIIASDFMPAARRNKMLRPLDRWVISAALDHCAQQNTDTIFVKISHESVLDETLVDWLNKLAKDRQLKPQQLCLQISEEDATQYLKQTRTLAEQLKSNGFLVAIEHFGVGRDPSRVLTQTPMHYLKIDGSLMQSLATNPELQTRVRGYVETAEKRKIQTIAERVEDTNTMAVLFQLGVGYMQGHYLQEAQVVLAEG